MNNETKITALGKGNAPSKPTSALSKYQSKTSTVVRSSPSYADCCYNQKKYFRRPKIMELYL